MNADKKKALTILLTTVNELANVGGPDSYQLNKMRKAADELGYRAELDEFFKTSWGMTIRKSKKVGKKAGKKKRTAS